ATERAPTTRGVTDTEIRLGISAPFTGSAKELGNQMKLGIQTAFNLINDAGGIHGRQLKLVTADDGYEPTPNGVIVTQVVPAVDSYASTILKYKTALAKYFPGAPPEGYVAGSVLLE